MADSKLSALPSGSAVAGADLFYSDQGGVSVKQPASAIQTYATSGLTITSTTGSLTIANSKTLTVSNTLTLAGTDSSTLNIGAGGTLGTNAFNSTAFLPLTGGTLSGTLTAADAGTWGSSGISTGVIAATTSLNVAGAQIGSNPLAVQLSNSQTTVALFSSNAAATTTASHNGIQVVGNDNGNPALNIDAYGTNAGAAQWGIIHFRSARGTGASPSQTLSGDVIGRVISRGRPSSGSNFSGDLSTISFLAGGNITSSSQPGIISFQTTAVNSTSGSSVPSVGSFMPSGAFLVGNNTFTLALANDLGNGIIEAQTGLALFGSSSGNILLQAPATGGGTLTLPPGADTIAGIAATQTLTNKTISISSNTLTGVAPLASPIFTGTVTMPDSSTITSSGLSGTTINNSSIGATTRSTGAFTTLTANSTANFTGTFQINGNTITWPAAAISVARIDAAQTFNGTQTFQAAGATSGDAQITVVTNASSSSFQAVNFFNDLGNTSLVRMNNSAAAATTVTNQVAALTVNSGLGPLYLGTQSSGKAVVFYAGGTSPTANNAITITSPTAIAFNQYTTAGLLQNDASGNLTSNGASNAAPSPIVLKGYTVATLPVNPGTGATAYVTDALSPTFLVAVTGGGAVITPVFYNGTNWVGG